MPPFLFSGQCCGQEMNGPLPVEETYIRQAEEKLGVEFPVSFRMNMMRDNGSEMATGEDDGRRFPFRDSCDMNRPGRTSNEIVRETGSAQQWTKFPPDGIAVASNGAGDLLVFERAVPSGTALEEAVYMWSHETGALAEVASSFSESIVKYVLTSPPRRSPAADRSYPDNRGDY